MGTARAGYDALIYVDQSGAGTNFVKVAGQRGANLTRSLETIDVTDKDSLNWMEYLASLRSWTLDFDGLVELDDSGYTWLETCFTNRSTVQVRLSAPNGSTTYIGSAIITELSNEAPHDDAFTFSASFQGTGALTKA